MCCVDNVVEPHDLAQTKESAVGTPECVVLDRQRTTTSAAVVIAGFVRIRISTRVVELTRRRCVDAVGRNQAATLERRCEHEWFERRTGRSTLLRGDVELELVEPRSADHCSDCTGPWLDRHQADNDSQIVVCIELCGHCVLGERLSNRVEGGVHLEPTLKHAVDPVGSCLAQAWVIEQASFHLFDEVRVEVTIPIVLAVSRKLADLPEFTLLFVDETLIDQPPKRRTPTIQRVRRSIHRVVQARVGDDASEQCRLSVVERIGVLVEVELGGRLHTIGTTAEVDGVEVSLEDLVFGHLLFESHRDRSFRDLALEHLRVADNAKLHELLGDGRTALLDATRRNVRHRRARDRCDVDPLVLIEAIVLDRQHRSNDLRRHLIERQVLTIDLGP